MKKKDKRTGDTADLRKRAEEKFRAADAKTKKKLTPLVGRRSKAPAGVDFQGVLKETRKMLHELRVHQIELEMQNEELLRAQAKLDAARARYFDLYDLAPVGYCTVSEQGLILEANLTAAKLFGWERKQLVKQPLTSFIHNEDQDVYYRLRKQLFESGAPQVCELRMLNKEGNHFWARLEAAVAQDADGALVGRVVLSDISDRMQLEQEVEHMALFPMQNPNPVLEMGTDGVVNFANPATMSTLARLGLDPDVRQFLSGAPEELVLLRSQCEQNPQTKEICLGGTTFLRVVSAPSGNVSLRIYAVDITERKQIEETLRKSEENFRLSLEDSPLGVRIATAKGETIYANKVFLDLYGYESIDEFNGIPINERYTHQSYAESRIRKKTRDQGDFGPSVYEINIVRKNKEIRHLLVLRKEVLWNGTKQFQIIYQDIGERKRAEAALRESEERYRAMMEQAADAVFVHDETGRILDVNRKTCQNLGYSREELLSKSIGDIDPEASQTKKNELWDKILAGEQFTFESCQIRKDGSVIPVEVTLGSVHLPLGPAVLGLVRDITERKRTEAALRESEEKYRTLFTSSSDAIMLIEPLSGKFISGNQTTMAMFGLKNDDDVSSFGPWDFSPERQPDDRASAEKAKEMNEIAMRDGSNFFEWTHKQLNGEEFSTNVRLTRMVLEKKTILQATVRDITERKRAEKEICASLAEKEILLKEVHHRVKNNLMIIIGLIKIQETKANNEMLNPLLQELEGRIRSMALVHESLHKSADLAHVDLQNYIETMIAHIHAQFGSECDIRFSVQGVVVAMDLDFAVPYGLILNELITNACMHAFPGDKPRAGEGNCEINVVMEQVGGALTLTVADNGVGLPAGLDWEKSETLGLRLIKMLSQQINSSIELDRSAGTAFRLKFPVAKKIN